ncbi:hypothetical protein [Lacihabitans lacunae]|uniref:Uncharacterized protein n=1 Tax=Lacihabitans lacunae TaxID=1028214 RepID=A0ABV7YU83_9BACT
MLPILIKGLLVGIILALVVGGYILIMSGRNGWITLHAFLKLGQDRTNNPEE